MEHLDTTPPVWYTGDMATREDIEQAQLRGETPKAKKAFLDFMGLGPSRTLKMLVTIYRDPEKYAQDPKQEGYPPTRQLKKLQTWSAAFKWQERISQVQDRQINALVQEEERQALQAMRMKYAGKADRIAALSQIAELLMSRVADKGIETVIIKQVGSGKNTEMVEERQVDINLISSIRGVLSDLAAETGGRVKKLITDNQGGPLVDNRTIFLLPAIAEVPAPPALPADLWTEAPVSSGPIPVQLTPGEVEVIDVPGYDDADEEPD